MSNLKNFTDLTIKQDVYTSGSLKVFTSGSFITSVTTSSDGMYDVDNSLHTLDEKIKENLLTIKNAYEGARFKYTGSFDASGNATINLTSLAPSGSTYFNTSSINDIDVQILVDTNGDLHYRNDLISVDLHVSNGELVIDLEAPGSPSKPYRVLFINEKQFIAGETIVPEIVIVLNDWTESAVLSGSYAVESSDNFGNSVAINSLGNRMVIGAQSDETGSTTSTGLAYVFQSSSAGWIEEKVLTGSYAVNSSDFFGSSVAINSNGNKIIVGAYQDEVGLTASLGVVYVFQSSSNGWVEESALTNSYFMSGSDSFGFSVTLNSSGNKIAVGARNDETGSTTATGLAYVFQSSSAGWIEEKVLTGSYAVNASDWFGSSIAMNSNGNRIIVGAQDDEESLLNTGLAYIFQSSSNGWIEEKVLTGSYAINSSDRFGISVCINSTGNIVVVGASNDETGSTGGTGLAYIFKSSSAGWIEEKVLTGSYAVEGTDWFGYSTCINSIGDIIVVGAFQDETGSTTSTGLAYVFQSSSSGWVEKKVLTGSYAVNASDGLGSSVCINTIGSVIAVGASADEISSSTSYGLVYVFTGSAS